MSRAVYRICVCEYAYNGAHGAPYWADFTGNGARSRALEAMQRSTVTHVQIVNMSNGRAFCNGRLVLDVRNELAKPPASARDREIQLGNVR